MIAFGPIHARGTDDQISDTKDKFVFPKGSVTVVHHAKHASDSYDPVTCYGTQNENGTYRVFDGTGAYAHAHGYGTYTLKIFFVGCSQTQPPDVFSLRVSASGPLWK